MRGSLQSVRLSDLDPGDLVEFFCRCHYEVVVRPLVLRALRGRRFIPDDTKVLDLALRWRCQNCGYRGPESRVRVISAGPAGAALDPGLCQSAATITRGSQNMAKMPKVTRETDVHLFLQGLKMDRRSVLDGILAGSKGYDDEDLRKLGLLQQAIAAVEAELAEEKAAASAEAKKAMMKKITGRNRH